MTFAIDYLRLYYSVDSISEIFRTCDEAKLLLLLLTSRSSLGSPRKFQLDGLFAGEDMYHKSYCTSWND